MELFYQKSCSEFYMIFMDLLDKSLTPCEDFQILYWIKRSVNLLACRVGFTPPETYFWQDSARNLVSGAFY